MTIKSIKSIKSLSNDQENAQVNEIKQEIYLLYS